MSNEIKSTVDGSRAVLIVDDEEVVRHTAEIILQRSGYKVLTAASGEEALKLYGGQPGSIETVIIDLTLPGLSGKQLVQEFKAIEPNVRIVVTSGYDRESALQSFDGEAVDGFLPKPFRAQEIIDVIQSAAKGNA